MGPSSGFRIGIIFLIYIVTSIFLSCLSYCILDVCLKARHSKRIQRRFVGFAFFVTIPVFLALVLIAASPADMNMPWLLNDFVIAFLFVIGTAMICQVLCLHKLDQVIAIEENRTSSSTSETENEISSVGQNLSIMDHPPLYSQLSRLFSFKRTKSGSASAPTTKSPPTYEEAIFFPWYHSLDLCFNWNIKLSHSLMYLFLRNSSLYELFIIRISSIFRLLFNFLAIFIDPRGRPVVAAHSCLSVVPNLQNTAKKSR